MFKTHVIRDFSFNNYGFQAFCDKLKEYESRGFSFTVGTDSQIAGNVMSVVTVICCHKFGMTGGSKIFYIKTKSVIDKVISLKLRMTNEAFQSIEAAMFLETLLSAPIAIHLDIGSEARSDTSRFSNELIGLVSSQGFSCAIKPYAWAASAAADRMARV